MGTGRTRIHVSLPETIPGQHDHVHSTPRVFTQPTTPGPRPNLSHKKSDSREKRLPSWSLVVSFLDPRVSAPVDKLGTHVLQFHLCYLHTCRYHICRVRWREMLVGWKKRCWKSAWLHLARPTEQTDCMPYQKLRTCWHSRSTRAHGRCTSHT